jgi:hypothetical protein
MIEPRQDETNAFDSFDELSSSRAFLDHAVPAAGNGPSTHDDLQPIGVELPTVDAEIIITELEVRERLIEWLVGFLPGGALANQASH